MRSPAGANELGQTLKVVASHPIEYLRNAIRLPLQQQAAKRIAGLPLIDLVEFIGYGQESSIRLPSRDSRHSWSLGLAGQLCLQILINTRRYSTAFEIGTFNGGTTRVLAETVPDGGHVWTLDLPQPDFDATQRAPGFDGSQVGCVYRHSPAAEKITQLFGDSRTFDFRPYQRAADLVLVDAGHEYSNGYADTLAALHVVRPGGIVVWDDFEPYWHGLVHGVCDAMEGRPLARLAGTSLAIFSNAT